MNQYVTGTVIKELREKNKMTQLQLADRLGVCDKTVSKWEKRRYSATEFFFRRSKRKQAMNST